MFRKDIRCALVAFPMESVRNRASFASGSKSLTWLVWRSSVSFFNERHLAKEVSPAIELDELSALSSNYSPLAQAVLESGERSGC